MRQVYWDVIWTLMFCGWLGVDIWKYAEGDQSKIVWIAITSLMITFWVFVARRDYQIAVAEAADEDENDAGPS